MTRPPLAALAVVAVLAAGLAAGNVTAPAASTVTSPTASTVTSPTLERLPSTSAPAPAPGPADLQQRLQRLQEQRRLCARCDCFALRGDNRRRVPLDENLDEVRAPSATAEPEPPRVDPESQVLVINCTSRLPAEELPRWSWPARLSSGQAAAVAAEVWAEFRGGDLSGVSRLPLLPFRLTRLSLAGNRLRAVAPRAFANLAALTHLDLGDNVIVDIPHDAFLGMASLQRLDLSGNGLSSRPLSADLFKGLDKLAVVSLAGNRLDGDLNGDTLPWSASILDLNLTRNGLTGVSAGAWRRLPNLKVLDLSHNKLVSLTPNAFAELRSLERLDLSGNALAALPPGSLAGLGAVRALNLAHNGLSGLPADAFVPLAALAELDLSWNALSPSSGALAALGALPGSLRALDASHNPLGLPEGGLEGRREAGAALPPGLELLSLEGCGLHELDARAWGGLSGLRRLQLAGNDISVLGDLARLDDLRELNVSGNALTRFPAVELPALRALDVSRNQLERAPAPLAPRLAALLLDENPVEELRLAAPALALLSARRMPRLRALARLRVDGNDSCLALHLRDNPLLDDVREDALAGVRLCELDLSHNALQSLPPGLTNWTALAALDLQGNPWACSCRLQWMLDTVVRQLYAADPALLEELRCAGPEALAGRRLVHWYNHTGRALCDGGAMDLLDGAGRVTFRMSTASLAVMASLGVVAVGLVVLGILAHRKYVGRRRQRNRRF